MADERTYEERQAYYKEWREKNKAKVKEYAQKDYEKHKEARLAKNKVWRDGHPEYFENQHKEYRDEHPDYDKCHWHSHGRRNHAARNYGLTHEEFDALKPRLDNGPCDTCGKVGKTVIDHDHQTDKFRGTICAHCNKVIGFAKDDPELLRNIAAYLELKR